MAKRLKFGNVVVCEHVVSGGSNKHTLINVYAGDIVVAALPARLALGFYFELKDIERDMNLEIDIKLGNATIAKLGANIVGHGTGDGVLAVPMIPMEIQSDTKLIVYFSAEGFARTKALQKSIFQGEIPNATRPTA